MFRSLLIANRGEIALRILRTARRMGLRTVAVYSDADRDARHAREADAAVRIGAAAPSASYLNIPALVDAARATGAEAVHPGYGFLAESADFAQAVIYAGLGWIGPPPAAIRAMGDKRGARRLAAQAGAPVLPGHDEGAQDDAALASAAKRIGYPLMVKAAAGGGGRGIRIVRTAPQLAAALAAARSEAEHAFGDGTLLLERAVERARHVEVQVFADAHGACIHLGERDCSVQRRHQKLVEESPSPAVDEALRARMGAASVAIARAAGYVGAGTIEYLLDADGGFWFMEMNTRLQVEHPVTEARTGLDLVEWQLRVAAGEALPLAQDAVRFDGHAIEARLCAEDPAQEHLPQAGRLLRWQPDPGIRVEHALEDGAAIPPHYDSMIAKLIAHAPTREAARTRLAEALDTTVALGLPTNREFLARVLRDADFAAGRAHTGFLDAFHFAPPEPDEADYATAACLRVADRGEWTGWSNDPSHAGRTNFGGTLRSVAPTPAAVAAARATPHAVDGPTVHFARHGASIALRDALNDPPARRGTGPSDGRLAAPMNGRVAAVHAKPGDRVAAGQPLVVLEAMKMEHGLALGVEARITAVHVAAGAQVGPGQLLVEFEPAAA